MGTGRGGSGAAGAAVPAPGPGSAERGWLRPQRLGSGRRPSAALARSKRSGHREVGQPCVLETSGNKSIKANQMKLIEALEH